MEDYPLKRISLMIGEHQHERIHDEKLNISGFVRGLIEDHFSDHVVTLSVSEKTHRLYREIFSNTGATDKDIEPYFIEALEKMLEERIQKMSKLMRSIEKKK